MLNTFRFRLTLLVGLFTVAVMGILAWTLGNAVADAQERDQGDALHAIARNASRSIGVGLDERMRDIEVLASTPAGVRPTLPSPLWRAVLEEHQQARPEFAWIGVTDADGTVRSATGSLLEGVDVSERPWFTSAIAGPYTGDVHPAKLLESLLEPSPTGEPLRFIDFAMPLHDRDGTALGVLGAHANWAWVGDLIAESHTDRDRDRGAETFILNSTGEVIHQPDRLVGDVAPLGDTPTSIPDRHQWTDGTFLTVAVPFEARNPTTDLGWTIVTRQPVDAALTAADEARRTVLIAAAAATLALMALVWIAVGRFSRPLQALSTTARRIEAGAFDTRIEPVGRSTELTMLSTSLTGMTETLIQRELDLEEANADLEAKVAHRTVELEQANAELDRLARHDALTGLLNRRAFDVRLREEFARHRRNRATMSVALLDIDHFKQVNDTFGHPAGDLVLRAVADCLGATCRETDVIARYGGEEFVVILTDTAPEDAHRVTERIRRSVESCAVPLDGLSVTISIGTATSAELFDDPTAAIDAADRALYRAKQNGRNRAEFDDALAIELPIADFSH